MCIKNRDDKYEPPTIESKTYKNWVAVLDAKVCLRCFERHGKIYLISEHVDEAPPLHNRCRCDIKIMESVEAGFGTKNGRDGADWWLKYVGTLPDYYISGIAIKELGWRNGKTPAKFAPGKMITMGVYDNENGHLPQTPKRVWYEADINYYEGKRNGHRVLWSNDGLIFVTYDHYITFYEIV